MFPVSGLQPNKRKMALPANGKKSGQKVDEAQSKDILGELFNELDQNDADELDEARRLPDNAQVVNEQGQVAFSKHEEMVFKAAIAQSSNPIPTANAVVSTGKLVPSLNPFNKKRQHSEITSAEPVRTNAQPSRVEDESNDVTM